jgi:putative nucleotidyltransferase with HDIG domain
MKKKVRKNNKLEEFIRKRKHVTSISLSVTLLAVFFFFITLNNVHTDTYDIKRFSTANETIRSPITIENEQETERKTRETVQSVPDRFNISSEITRERVNYVKEIFDAIATLESEEMSETEDEEANGDRIVPLSNQDKVNRLKQILSEQITESLDNQTLMQIIMTPKDEREIGRELLVGNLETVLNNGVRTENIQSAISEINQSIKYASLNEELKQPLIELSEFAVVENSFFDVEQTQEARKEAASNVGPVMIRAGEVIVQEGQTITNEIYEELNLVGLLDGQRNFFPAIGLGLLIILISSTIAYELSILRKQNKLEKGKLISIISISILIISLLKIVSLFLTSGNQMFYIVPIATGAFLLKLLINERVAIIFSALFSIISGIIFNGEIPGSLNIDAVIYFFFSQLAAITFLTNVKDRTSILKAGIGVMVVNIITILLFVFLSFEKYDLIDLLIQSGFGIVSAFLSVVLTIGLLPFFETVLGVLSDMKLLQLSNPNQPLLKKLLTETPGTYHHSVMVANLSETACEAVGANGLLARVGAYYHDIGKTVRPQYFIENQMTKRNPHDFIDPKESAKIIISHPYDGANQLKKYKLPKEIIDIAEQHHGTSLLKFFYYKEKEKNENIDETSFRYPGPKPQTKEAAIICICDSVEAAVRSLNEPTEEKIEEIVAAIINDRMMDGQLDESPLTLKQLKIINRTICGTLKGIFHSRIQYPSKEAK